MKLKNNINRNIQTQLPQSPVVYKLTWKLKAKSVDSWTLACKHVSAMGRHKITKLTKQVRFNEEYLVEVILFHDDEESKNLRKTYWEVFALDRFRFNDRIANTEDELKYVFDSKHRERIYSQRFEYWTNDCMSCNFLNFIGAEVPDEKRKVNVCPPDSTSRQLYSWIWISFFFAPDMKTCLTIAVLTNTLLWISW